MSAVPVLDAAVLAAPPALGVALVIVAAVVACGLAVHAQGQCRRGARLPAFALGGLLLVAAAALMGGPAGAGLALVSYGGFVWLVERARASQGGIPLRG